MSRATNNAVLRRQVKAQLERLRRDEPTLLLPGPDSQAITLNIRGIGPVLVIEGAQGPSGPPAKRGSIGPEGLPGEGGPQGLRGLIGLSGHVGAKGEQGSRGFPGDIGLTGLEGPIGKEGRQGVRGDRGFVGLRGKIGKSGEKGEPGEGPTDSELRKLINDILRDNTRTSPGLIPTTVSTGSGSGGAVAKNRYDAISTPGVADDTQQGYAIGSRWIDISADEEYVCLDSTAGAAVWLNTTHTSGDVDTLIETHAAIATAHHTKYTDAEVDTIVAVHAAIAGSHHAKYTDLEAIAAVEGEATLDVKILTATSYGGITEANLVDKSAAESIAAQWIWTAGGVKVNDSIPIVLGSDDDGSLQWDGTDIILDNSFIVDATGATVAFGFNIKGPTGASTTPAYPGFRIRADIAGDDKLERLDIGWGGQGGSNLELYSGDHLTRAGRYGIVYGAQGASTGQFLVTHNTGVGTWVNRLAVDNAGIVNCFTGLNVVEEDDAEGVKLQFEYVNGNTSGRVFFAENANDAIGFSLLYAGSANPTLGGKLMSLATNRFALVRHTNSDAGIINMVFNRDDGNVSIPGALVIGADAAPTAGFELDVRNDIRAAGQIQIEGDLNHDGSNVGFYATAPIAKQTGVAVTAAGIHAALVNLGLIAA